jgi:hypothetical protein
MVLHDRRAALDLSIAFGRSSGAVVGMYQRLDQVEGDGWGWGDADNLEKLRRGDSGARCLVCDQMPDLANALSQQ